MTALIIIGYVVCWIASVPLMSRAFYDPDDRGFCGDKNFTVGLAIVDGAVWPFFAIIGLIVLLTRLVTPLIFRGER